MALTWWTVDVWGEPMMLDIMQAVKRGYTDIIALNQTELTALPTLFKLRALVSASHRLSRYQAGLDEEPSVLSRIDDALWWQTWLDKHDFTSWFSEG